MDKKNNSRSNINRTSNNFKKAAMQNNRRPEAHKAQMPNNSVELRKVKRRQLSANFEEELRKRRKNYIKKKKQFEKKQEKLYRKEIRKQKISEKFHQRKLEFNSSDNKSISTNLKPKKKPNFAVKFFSARAGIDLPFLILVLVLVVIGLIMMFSASYANAYYYYHDSYKFIKNQLPMAIVGIILMFAISYMDYHVLKKAVYPIMAISFLLLIAVLLMPAVNKVHRWIQLGSFSFQASEITKFSIILFFAYMIDINFNEMDQIKKGVLPFIAVLFANIILLAKEPHVSCIVIITALAGLMLFIGGVKLKWFASVIGAIAAVGVYVILFTKKLSYANDRVAGWLDPLTYRNYDQWQNTWQTRNSLYAIGSGRLLGLGLGNSRQKYMYLPEPQNDFVFAIVCEELGMIGALIILLLFAMLVWRGVSVCMRAQDKFGALLGIGLVLQVGLQAVLNIAVVTNSVPNTGISLPFFSYGGTSLLMLLVQMGIVLSISRSARIEKL